MRRREEREGGEERRGGEEGCGGKMRGEKGMRREVQRGID